MKEKKSELVRALHAVWRLEERERDARAKGEWMEVSRCEKQLKVARRRYAAAAVQQDIVESRARRRCLKS